MTLASESLDGERSLQSRCGRQLSYALFSHFEQLSTRQTPQLDLRYRVSQNPVSDHRAFSHQLPQRYQHSTMGLWSRYRSYGL